MNYRKLLGLSGFLLILTMGMILNSCSADKHKTLKLAHNLDPTHSVHIAMEYMAERLKEKSDGKIIIQLHQKDEVIHGMIRDNGVGLPEGFDIEKKESLGMTLIRNFMRQLEADGEMGSDNGAYIRFSFKKEDVHGSSSSGLLNSVS
jgi:nitrate/nitrite-specific signal transduction histidine kinase